MNFALDRNKFKFEDYSNELITEFLSIIEDKVNELYPIVEGSTIQS